jgi:GT2 family glycosyltransferase
VSRIGVVILTHDRADALSATLARMLALPDRPQIVVVDNASSDDTVARVGCEFPTVGLIPLPSNAGAAGRNAGVARLATPYVAFCDDDAWWAPGALTRAADLLDAHAEIAVVSGRVLVGPQERLDPACAAMDASPLPAPAGVPGRGILGFMCSASMVRRDAFLEAGGFEPRFFLGGEEELLAISLAAAGWALLYAPEVTVHHHPSAVRDAERRHRLLVRNALWCAWLRRPWRSAARRTLTLLRQRARWDDGRAILDALAGLPWVLRHRRVIPPDVEAALRRLETV